LSRHVINSLIEEVLVERGVVSVGFFLGHAGVRASSDLDLVATTVELKIRVRLTLTTLAHVAKARVTLIA
jgi:hypothetical protein